MNDVKVVTLGTEMIKLAQQQYGITDRDMMRHKLSAEDQGKLRRQVLASVNAMPEDLLLNTHASVKAALPIEGWKYLPGFSIPELEKLDNVLGIIMIDASATEIIERRKKDSAVRKREPETKDDIKQHRDINIGIMTSFAIRLNIPFYIIHNKEGRAQETTKELREVAKSVFG